MRAAEITVSPCTVYSPCDLHRTPRPAHSAVYTRHPTDRSALRMFVCPVPMPVMIMLMHDISINSPQSLVDITNQTRM